MIFRRVWSEGSMGRKSLADARREEILAAFERCIGQHGIDVPLERVADEAGVKRSLIRHYLGNRDELIDQVIARIATSYPQRISDLLTLARARGAEGLLDVLFSDESSSTDWDNLIIAVVSTAHGRYPEAKRQVATMMVVVVEQVAQALQQIAPDATPAACYEVAYGLLCLVQTHDSLLWLGIDPRHTAVARAGAERLIDGLARCEG